MRRRADIKPWPKKGHHWKQIHSWEKPLFLPRSPIPDNRVRWCARVTKGQVHTFAYLPAQRFRGRFDVPPVEVTFSLGSGRDVQCTFRPDTAVWLRTPLSSAVP